MASTQPTIQLDEDLTPPVLDPSKPWYSAIKPGVFIPAVVIIVGFILFSVLAPTTAAEVLAAIRSSVIEYVGWYYALLVTAFVVFAVWMGASHFGDIKLAHEDESDEKPEFGMGAWLAMLFAAGMGIGLVFWGVAEPLNYFADTDNYNIINAPTGDPAGAAEASLVQSFLHWGLHPWAIYVIVGLAVAYSVHVKRRPISLRWTLEPLSSIKKLKGWRGNVVDVIAVVGTLFGVATSLGFGVMQIASGLEIVEITDETSPLALVYLLLIGIITLIATASVVSGVGKGIKWLSNINMGMALALLLFVFVSGASLYFVRQYIEGIGAYLSSFLTLSFNTAATTGPAGVDWQGAWTAFYWGWWISWAPFVGVFIARISKGRTVREFVLGVLLVPALFSLLWFTVLGGGALKVEIEQGGLIIDGGVDTEGVLFSFLQTFPGGTIVAGLTILLIAMFFITSSDSGSLVIDMLASGGMVEPPTWSRVMWSLIEGAAAAALLLAGLATLAREAGVGLFQLTSADVAALNLDPADSGSALSALQDMAITIAFPFSIIMILMCVALVKEFHRQRSLTLRAERRLRRQELTQEVAETLVEDGLVVTTPGDGRARFAWRRKK